MMSDNTHIERDPAKREPGQWAGLSADDYRKAIEEHGSIRGAAKRLGVSRATVREAMARHKIENPWTGEVPNVKLA